MGKGDARRTALLEALDLELQESSLESITIADISRRAGVTRSAFYFYFENKALATAALMEQLYDDSMAAAALLTAGDGSPAERVEAMVRALFGAWDRHQHLFRAMLDARATSAAVRELWDADRSSFVPTVAAVVAAQRPDLDEAGAAALASVLLELNDRMLERLALGGDLTHEQLVDTVVSVWLRCIYGDPA